MSLSFLREGIFLTGRVVLTADDIRRAVRRIAHEIVERNHGAGNITLVGLRTRGVPLAERLASAIEEFEGERPPVGALDIGLYRDDLSSTELRARIQPTDMPAGVDGRYVVLVDDVLFTGRSIRAALDALTDFGRPAEIQLAVLVDRGHRQLPIRADYVGKNIPTSVHERVFVRVADIDDIDDVLVMSVGKQLLGSSKRSNVEVQDGSKSDDRDVGVQSKNARQNEPEAYPSQRR